MGMYEPGGAGGGVPGGADSHVQYNATGAFGGSVDYTFDKASVWTYGGVSNDVYIKLGSGAAAAIVSGQHLIDLGASVGGAVGTADAAILRLQGTGAVTPNGHTYFGWDTARLFLRLNNTHRWYFTNEASQTYDWQVGTVVWTDRASNNGEMTCQFSLGLFAIYDQSAARRRIELNASLSSAPVSANTFFITGSNDNPFDLWDIRTTGNNANIRLRPATRLDIYPAGIHNISGASMGVRLAPNAYMRNDTSGYFAFVDVMNEDFDIGPRFWRPSSGTATGHVYGAGSTGVPLHIDTGAAAGSAFYAYGADLNHAAGSGTVGFWEYRSNGTVISAMLLNGDIVAGNYTGIGDQNLTITTGAQSGTGGGFDLILNASAGGGAGAQDGGDVQISGGAGSGGGVEGAIEIQSHITTNLVNIHTIGAVANSFNTIVVNGVQAGNDLTLSLESGAQTSSGNGRELFLQGGDANTSGDGGDIRLTCGALAGAGAEGRVDFRNAANAVAGPPSAGASSQVDPEGYVRMKVNGTDRTIAYYLDV